MMMMVISTNKIKENKNSNNKTTIIKHNNVTKTK